MTTSPTIKFLRGRDHFWRCCKLRRNSFLHRVQNSFAKCWTRLQRFLQYMSAGWKAPGGARTTFDFIVKRWLGVSGLAESGSVSWVTKNGKMPVLAHFCPSLNLTQIPTNSHFSQSVKNHHNPFTPTPAQPPLFHLPNLFSVETNRKNCHFFL